MNILDTTELTVHLKSVKVTNIVLYVFYNFKTANLLGMVEQLCNPSPEEAEAEGSRI